MPSTTKAASNRYYTAQNYNDQRFNICKTTTSNRDANTS